MLRRKTGLILIGALVAALIVTTCLAISGQAKAANYRQQIDNNYQHSFAELNTAVSELDIALQKCLYATTPNLFSTLCTQAFSKAQNAQSALGELPYSNIELEKTASFLAKTGDYIMSLARKAYENNGCTEEDRKLLLALSDTSSTLSATLQDLQAELYAGRIKPEDVETVQKRLSVATEKGEQITSTLSFQTLEADFPETPSLIYDGPFSDHLTTRNPRMLEGKAEVSRESAQAEAAKFLDLDAAQLTFVTEGGESIATYDFSAPAPGGGEFYVQVTKAGGMVLSVLNSDVISEDRLTQEECVALALDFLKERGYDSLSPSYFITQNHTLTINFSTVQDDVICYPDLIRLSVAMDSGRLQGFEAHGYLNNHYTRDIPTATVSLADAQAVVSTNLQILSHQMVIIPTEGQYEVYCHEFKCRRENGDHAIVYINAQTGLEARILLLLEDESGSLAI